MIISASRRTDIPAFYAPWFMNRVREGYCVVPNPFNRRQLSRVSLALKNVDAIVFWTRNPEPILHFLPELDRRGYRYYFQVTVLGYPRLIDAHTPSIDISIRRFIRLVEAVGSDRVLWRYDPILITSLTNPDYHRDMFEQIASSLSGYTHRCIISVMTNYKKIFKRMNTLTDNGLELNLDPSKGTLAKLMSSLQESAKVHDMVLTSCADERGLEVLGMQPGKCVDDILLKNIFGLRVSSSKDPGQRGKCLCVRSRDIGMYDSCIYGCQYCYATSSFDRAVKNHALHDPHSPSLIGYLDVEQAAASGVEA